MTTYNNLSNTCDIYNQWTPNVKQVSTLYHQQYKPPMTCLVIDTCADIPANKWTSNQPSGVCRISSGPIWEQLLSWKGFAYATGACTVHMKQGWRGWCGQAPADPYGALWTPRRTHQDSLLGPEPHWGETARSGIKTEQVIDKREERKRRSRSKQGKGTQKTSESSCQSFEHHQTQQRSCSSVKLENLSWTPTHSKVRKPNFAKKWITKKHQGQIPHKVIIRKIKRNKITSL